MFFGRYTISVFLSCSFLVYKVLSNAKMWIFTFLEHESNAYLNGIEFYTLISNRYRLSCIIIPTFTRFLMIFQNTADPGNRQ